MPKEYNHTIEQESSTSMVNDDSLVMASADVLRQQCVEALMNISDINILGEIKQRLRSVLKSESSHIHSTYSIEELNMRQQDAIAEFKAGGGMDGKQFFEQMTQYIASR